jgi:tRNA dimethylallyltransferase
MKTVIAVVGPTAVGKTALSIRLAESLRTSIVSADSRQCYRELNIGVARPSPEELQHIHHYFIASHSVEETVNAAIFEQYALDATEDIFSRSDTAVMVGGTGLYIRAFEQGLDPMPPIPEPIRSIVREGYQAGGLAWLQGELQARDPAWYAGGEVHNPHRLLRALEVVLATGQSIRHFQGGEAAKRDFHFVKIGLDLPKAHLYDRINARVDQMMEQGLLEEVRGLLPYRQYNALETVGYKELFAYLDGEISLSDAIALIKRHTRHYAKRQSTWFRKDPGIVWFEPGDGDKILAHLMADR